MKIYIGMTFVAIEMSDMSKVNVKFYILMSNFAKT